MEFRSDLTLKDFALDYIEKSKKTNDTIAKAYLLGQASAFGTVYLMDNDGDEDFRDLLLEAIDKHERLV